MREHRGRRGCPEPAVQPRRWAAPAVRARGPGTPGQLRARLRLPPQRSHAGVGPRERAPRHAMGDGRNGKGTSRTCAAGPGPARGRQRSGERGGPAGGAESARSGAEPARASAFVRGRAQRAPRSPGAGPAAPALRRLGRRRGALGTGGREQRSRAEPPPPPPPPS